MTGELIGPNPNILDLRFKARKMCVGYQGKEIVVPNIGVDLLKVFINNPRKPFTIDDLSAALPKREREIPQLTARQTLAYLNEYFRSSFESERTYPYSHLIKYNHDWKTKVSTYELDADINFINGAEELVKPTQKQGAESKALNPAQEAAVYSASNGELGSSRDAIDTSAESLQQHLQRITTGLDLEDGEIDEFINQANKQLTTHGVSKRDLEKNLWSSGGGVGTIDALTALLRNGIILGHIIHQGEQGDLEVQEINAASRFNIGKLIRSNRWDQKELVAAIENLPEIERALLLESLSTEFKTDFGYPPAFSPQEQRIIDAINWVKGTGYGPAMLRSITVPQHERYEEIKYGYYDYDNEKLRRSFKYYERPRSEQKGISLNTELNFAIENHTNSSFSSSYFSEYSVYLSENPKSFAACDPERIKAIGELVVAAQHIFNEDIVTRRFLENSRKNMAFLEKWGKNPDYAVVGDIVKEMSEDSHKHLDKVLTLRKKVADNLRALVPQANELGVSRLLGHMGDVDIYLDTEKTPKIYTPDTDHFSVDKLIEHTRNIRSKLH